MQQRLTDCNDPLAAIVELAAGFVPDPNRALAAEELTGESLPQPFRDLLVHDEHMTERLRQHYAGDVALHAVHTEEHDDVYRRIILLTRADGAPVELGMVRIHLDCIAPEVVAEIRAKQAPLGDILIRHDVLRRIEPRWFLRFTNPAACAAAWSVSHSGDLYGRVGIIHYEHRPAIELLEILTGV